jgi:hypothetical protein
MFLILDYVMNSNFMHTPKTSVLCKPLKPLKKQFAVRTTFRTYHRRLRPNRRGGYGHELRRALGAS